MIEEMCNEAFTDQEFEDQICHYQQILPHTDARLHQTCGPVDIAYIESGQMFPLIMMMTTHLERNGGLGLAANQVGGDRRIIVMRYEDQMMPMINPIITHKSGHTTLVERCLSVNSGETGYAVKRAKKIQVRFNTFREVGGELEYGESHATLSKLAAVVCQHEVDHLNGVTIVDKGKLVSEPNKELA